MPLFSASLAVSSLAPVAFAFATASFCSTCLPLLHLFLNCSTLVKRVSVLAAVDAVRLACGGVSVFAVQVCILCTGWVTLAERSAIRSDSPFPFLLSIELFHVLSRQCASPRLCGGCQELRVGCRCFACARRSLAVDCIGHIEWSLRSTVVGSAIRAGLTSDGVRGLLVGAKELSDFGSGAFPPVSLLEYLLF